MLQATGLKRLAFNHFGSAVLAFGILVSSLTVVATVALAGDLPGLGGNAHSQSSSRAEVALPRAASAQDAERRELVMQRSEFTDWRHATASGPAVATDDVAIPASASAGDAERRALNMERSEFTDWRHSTMSGSTVATDEDALQRELRMERDEYLRWPR
jgi:hypothetical protein